MSDPSLTSCRIVSLLPAATEIVWALGLKEQLVGRSHECDQPPEVVGLPSLTRSKIDASASSRRIHEAVAEAFANPKGDSGCAGASTSLYSLDIARLAALKPDVILTQAACEVCAISANDVVRAVEESGHEAHILALSPATLADVFNDIVRVGDATGTLNKAREVVARLRARVDSVACRVTAIGRVSGSDRPQVAIIEWLDPPMAAGNWVPELVRLAGGHDLFGKAGEHSDWIRSEDLAAADPDLIVLSPCGFTLKRVQAEAASLEFRVQLQKLRAFREGRVYAVDGHHLFNRPGPRLVESLEVLAELFYPGAFRFCATEKFAAIVA
ncbi:MAG: cobalamin-binding protein [Planctomycetota bacterium]